MRHSAPHGDLSGAAPQRADTGFEQQRSTRDRFADPLSGAGAGKVAGNQVETGLGSAHGKAILLGEHSVVYGAPAIVLPLLDLQATASIRRARRGFITSDLYTGPLAAAPKHMDPVLTALRVSAEQMDVRADRVELILRSTVPFERGLGSSAATSAAVVRAVANLAGIRLNGAQAHALVQEAEHVAHGTSSGLDAHAVQSMTPLRFQQGKPTTVKVADRFTFVIADTGTSGSTAAAVDGVSMLRDIQPREIGLNGAQAHALVQEAEHVAHGTSSGLDAHAVQSMTPLRFQQGKPTTVKVADRFTFVIADTGTSGSTAAAVDGVSMLRDIQPRAVHTDGR